MTPKQINESIAEACGYKMAGLGILHPYGYCVPMPHFYTDLNAMHEAEKVLGDKLSQYGNMLRNITQANKGDRPEAYIWHATARQRAEAFLRTLGKWEEVQG